VALVALRPLRHRRFALLFVSGAVSNIGTWMETVAVGALVYKATGQAVWTTLVAAATFLPVGVLGPVGGALADRMDRRTFIMAANGFEACVAAALAVLAVTHHASPAAVISLVFLEGCSGALRMPFQQSVLPEVVPREDVLAAVSLGSAQYNAGRVVGPALAALVIALGGFGAAFTANAISFFAVIGAWVVIGAVPKPQASDEDAALGIWGLVRGGARVAWAEPGCRSAIVLIGVAAVLVSPFIALIPAKAGLLVGTATGPLASATGLLTTAQGVGAIVGALVLPPLAARYGQRRTIVAALVASPVAAAVFGLSPNLAMATVALTLLGMTYIGVLSGLSTIVQLRAPAAARARVLSLFFVALGVLYPVGSVIQGVLADQIGLGTTMASAAAVLVGAVVVIGALRPRFLHALQVEADEEPMPTAVAR
jgi:MFS family permease